jgi:hypothetical protein
MFIVGYHLKERRGLASDRRQGLLPRVENKTPERIS